MKNLFSILIFSFSLTVYSQVDLKLYSFDECTGEVKKLEFELADSNYKLYPDTDDIEKYLDFFSKPIKLSPGTYFVMYGSEIENTDYFNIRGSIELDLTKTKIYTDTITLPKIRVGWSMALHSNERYYFNCNKKCDGLETDYYKNGNKKLEGKFKEGIPLEIIYYHKNGNIKRHELFKNNGLEPYKILRYNDEKDLLEYEIRIIKGKKTIIKTYNGNNGLIKKEKLDYALY